MAPEPGPQAGFTLLEVLIAFIIVALSLAALFGGGLGGLRAATASGRYAEAVSRAQSHLAAASTGDALVASDRQGDEGRGYHWRVRISPIATTVQDPAARTGPVATLYAVSAAISWAEDGHTRSVQLDTQAVAAVATTASKTAP